MPAKIHLIPLTAAHAICSTPVRSAGRLAVHTRREFNTLSKGERCGRCDAILNGRRGPTIIGRRASRRDRP